MLCRKRRRRESEQEQEEEVGSKKQLCNVELRRGERERGKRERERKRKRCMGGWMDGSPASGKGKKRNKRRKMQMQRIISRLPTTIVMRLVVVGGVGGRSSWSSSCELAGCHRRAKLFLVPFRLLRVCVR